MLMTSNIKKKKELSVYNKKLGDLLRRERRELERENLEPAESRTSTFQLKFVKTVGL